MNYNIWNKWDPLKTVLLGNCYGPDFFKDIKNSKIRSALTQIAEETQEDLAYYEKVLKDFGCNVLRPQLDISDSIMNYVNASGAVAGHQGVPRAPLQPRDQQLIAGNRCVSTGKDHPAIHQTLLEYSNDTILGDDLPLPEFKYNEIACMQSGDWPKWQDYFYNQQSRDNLKEHVKKEIKDLDFYPMPLSSANSFVLGKKIMVGGKEFDYSKKLAGILFPEFNIEYTNIDGHIDANYHPLKPGVILSLYDVQNYKKTFPGWDVCYFPDQSWDKVKGFLKLKNKVMGKWWVPEQEDNDDFTYFVETWLQDWVGYVEETVFDVNVLVLDEHHVCVNNMNPILIDFLKKHKMEPIHIPWRHRYFWDGGLHCITLDLYREGKQQDYFPNRQTPVID